MNIFLLIRKNQGIFRYFLKISAIEFFPTLILGVMAAYFISYSPPSPYNSEGENINIFWQWLFTGILVPIIESAILIYCTSLALDVTKSYGLSAALGATPILLMHFSGGWVKLIVISWPFYIEALTYLELRRINFQVIKAFIFVVFLHAFHNSLLLFILYL